MDLSTNLLKTFSKVIASPQDTASNATINGTAKVEGDKKFVKLDGSDIYTPISEATDVQDGDRVLVSIKNHTATVIGNYTCPASARTASKFLNLRDDGLLIGNLNNNGENVGTGSLIAPGIYYIINENGKILASFGSETVNIGDSRASVKLCGGKGILYANDNGDMVIKADVGLDIEAPICALNGNELVSTRKLVTSGTIKATGSISPGKTASISKENISIPDGYVLAGIREITSNYNSVCDITSFYTHPSTNTVGVRLKNTGNTTISDLEVTIEWFALYSKGSLYKVDDEIEFTEDPEQEEVENPEQVEGEDPEQVEGEQT